MGDKRKKGFIIKKNKENTKNTMFALIYTTNILYTILQMQQTLLTLQQELQNYQLTWPEGYTFNNGRLYYFDLTSPGSKVNGEEQRFAHHRDKVWSI